MIIFTVGQWEKAEMRVMENASELESALLLGKHITVCQNHRAIESGEGTFFLLPKIESHFLTLVAGATP